MSRARFEIGSVNLWNASFGKAVGESVHLGSCRCSRRRSVWLRSNCWALQYKSARSRVHPFADQTIYTSIISSPPSYIRLSISLHSSRGHLAPPLGFLLHLSMGLLQVRCHHVPHEILHACLGMPAQHSASLREECMGFSAWRQGRERRGRRDLQQP